MEKIQVNSPRNQTIKRKLIEREVLCNIGPEVTFILGYDYYGEPPYTWDDVTNMYAASIDTLIDFVERELDGDEIHELQEHFVYKYGDDDDQSIEIEDLDPEELQRYLEEHHNFEADPAEILEWWKVTDWFERQLRNHGECTIEHSNIWGRCTSGQSILLDNVVSEIALGMEILEGQRNEWKVD